jgi:hypothetical protein
VNKVPTWNDHEFGAELATTGTQISQVSNEGSDCMEFSAVADVDAAALVKIGIDFDLDGTEDYTSPIDETHWHVARTLIHAPLGYGKDLRFVVRKEGDGRAVLAEIRLQRVTTCTGARVLLHGLPVGDACSDDTQCASGICCGRTDVPDGDGGTATFLGSCSQCCGNRACTGGATCKARSDTQLNPFIAPPLQCDPQQKHGAKDDPCFDDTDCQSTCDGASFVKDPSCADAGPGTSCATVEVHAGRCR